MRPVDLALFAPTGRVAGDDRVGGAPLENRVRSVV